MSSRNLASIALLAVVALATGFVLAGQVKAQLLTPSNQVARYQALVRSVQELEAANADSRRQIASLRGKIDSLESQAAAQSAATSASTSAMYCLVSAFSGSAGEVVIDQGPPLTSPIKVVAVGDRNRMQAALDDPSALPGVRARQVQFQVHLTFEGSPDVSLPAYDSSLQIPHVSPT